MSAVPKFGADNTEVAKYKLDKAKSLLVLDHPFFAALLAARDIVITSHTRTADVNARGHMRINPDFLAPMNVKQVMFLLAHEIMHYVLQHPGRLNGRDMRAWNIAGDKVINDMLLDMKVGEWIENGVTQQDARLMSTDELYVIEQQNKGGGKGKDDPLGGAGDDLRHDVMTPGELREIEANVKVDLKQAAQIAKIMGKLPNNVERLVDELVNVKTPWYAILERYMTRYRKDEYAWTRPNRRFVASGVYLPGRDNKVEMGEVVIGVDTSGSIGPKELAEFQAHVNRILYDCSPTVVHVVYCDAAVHGVDTYTPDELPITFKNAKGGGGTDFEPVFDWVKKTGAEPEVLVYLTDMYGNFPPRPSFDTVWLSTSGVGEAPFGEVIKVER